jgi:preprotein translocase subunit YajC
MSAFDYSLTVLTQVLIMAIMTAIYYYFWRKARKEHQQWLETRKTQSEY